MNDGPTALYRYFDDKDRLLYVGISGNLGGRQKAHIASSRWMELTARSEVTRYLTRDEAAEAEVEAIKTEQPLFNKQHNDTPEARAWLSAYLREVGRTDLESPPRMIRLAAAEDPAPQPSAEQSQPFKAISGLANITEDVTAILKDLTAVVKDLRERSELFERVVDHVEILGVVTERLAGELMETRARIDDIENRMAIPVPGTAKRPSTASKAPAGNGNVPLPFAP